MGHYRSEMGFEKHDAKEVREKQENRKRVARAIKKVIDKEGVEFVLADILIDPLMAQIDFDA